MSDNLMTTQTEEWRQHLVYENYDVSSRGRVRQREYIDAGGHRRKAKMKAISLLGSESGCDNRYFATGITHKGRSRRMKVATLVLETFVGPRPDGQIVLHGPGGQFDDRLENLCWGTYSQNNGVDKERDGTVARGERHGNSKLTDAQCNEIVSRYAAGDVVYRELAAEYSVSITHISHIVLGKRRQRPTPAAGTAA